MALALWESDRILIVSHFWRKKLFLFFDEIQIDWERFSSMTTAVMDFEVTNMYANLISSLPS